MRRLRAARGDLAALRFDEYDTAALHVTPSPYDSALRLPADGP
ncbi:hypothetical protein ACWGAN_07735 [Streptomyces sp. NPDC054945]